MDKFYYRLIFYIDNYNLMIILMFLILIFGIIFHRNNFLIISMILELIYLIAGYLLISLNLDLFVFIFLGITGAETAIGLSILLSYYQELNKNNQVV